MGARWVGAIDATSSQMYTATEAGGTWTASASSSAFGSARAECVAFGNGVWVAAGEQGKVVTASDSTGTWTAATSAGFGTANVVWGVAYGNGYWVGVSDLTSNAVRYATDPTGTWTAAATPGTTAAYAVAYFGGRWVANRSGGVSTTLDPTGTWTTTSVSPYVGFGQITYDGTNWIVIGDTKLLYSSDGTTWNSATPGLGGVNWRSACFANGYYVVGGGGTTPIRVSTSLAGTWSSPSSPGFGAGSYVFWIGYRNGVWAAGGYSGSQSVIRTTRDPLGTWAVASSYPTVSGSSYRGFDHNGGVESRILVRSQAVTRAAAF